MAVLALYMLLDAHNIHFGPDVEKQENKYQPEVNSTIVREAVSTHVHRMRLLGATEMGKQLLGCVFQFIPTEGGQ